MELINKDTPQVKEFISSLDSMLNGIESIVKHYKPHLNGERFLSNNEVSKKLNVSLRTLQEWRYNPQNEMFRLLGTKRSFSQNETFFFSHP